LYLVSRTEFEDGIVPQLGLRFGEIKQTHRVWPVRELVARVRDLIEQEYGDVWVEGEISNYRPAPSGHVYFTLKDADAQLPIVLFRRQAMLLRFRPEDGLHVLVRGKVSVYEQRGQMQMVAETMEPVGAGSLQLAFEQLKERLAAEGLFDAARKRKLPTFPQSVGIVTSPTGAVIRDFLNIVARRHSGLSVMIYPVSVQGDAAVGEIVAAIAELNAASRATGLVDLIVLARGGGSLEDLAAFNSEAVARAIANSVLPVVSAIGHETDFTIADFVADLRAPTPSAAAELITETQHTVAEDLASLTHRLERATRFQLLQARQKWSRLPAGRTESRIAQLLRRLQQRLDDLAGRFEESVQQHQRAVRKRTDELAAAVLRHDPRQQLALSNQRLASHHSRLELAVTHRLHEAAVMRGSLDARLNALSPLAVLERGYALVHDEAGRVVRVAAQLKIGELVKTRVSRGSFTSRVEAGQIESRENEKTETGKKK
jgi:exodeoxyribonuclease VII large subunit